MKNEQQRDDINYLLSSDPTEFDYDDAVCALLNLSDALVDIDFQLNDVPKSGFQGKNYNSWRVGAAYKRNKIFSAYRKFNFRVKELYLAKLQEIKCG